MLRGRHLVVRSRRGRLSGCEILGRNQSGVYLLAAARVVESVGVKGLRIFHLDRMNHSERRRFRRVMGL